MKIINMLSTNKNHYDGINKCLFITIHETGNKSKGSNAINHGNYINNGSKTTWHYTVDDKQVVKHFKNDAQCWHCGDGKGNGNLNSIGVEMCVNADGDFNKTIANTIELVQHLMNNLNIPLKNVVQHNHWSGKDCPQSIRNGKPMTWENFISSIKYAKPIEVDEPVKVLYKVQVGAYANKDNAIKLSNDLKLKGYNNFIVEVKQ